VFGVSSTAAQDSEATRGIALEELKLVQAVIVHQGDVGLRMKTWCITLIALLSGAAPSVDSDIDSAPFLVGTLPLSLIFL
jgi:hypothetical protein